ncbi:hypothetical protein RSOLAG22IIIB_03101 [Rhizoctonia solani]|uniref:MOSC domain-containing protein n=1 Tax=Rhizoctonia solani TaxID=456999 RepID=A0A0K6FMS5_9AGAM|nr:hypothetical protein RSOLAG22IIIB_03101 [Rhizoctonia solani]
MVSALQRKYLFSLESPVAVPLYFVVGVGSYWALSKAVNYIYASYDSAQNDPPKSLSTATGQDTRASLKDRSTTMVTSKLALAEGIDMKVTKLLVHPIKSCRGISLSESNVSAEGLQYDRQFLIIDARTHKFMTARQVAKMVLIETAIEAGETPLLSVSFPPESGLPSFKLYLEPTLETLSNWELISDIEIWRDRDLDAYVAESVSPGATASPSALLSSYMGRDVLLVLKGPKRRVALTTQTHPDLDAGYRFQDGYPLLVATTESLAVVQENVRRSAAGEDEWKVSGIAPQWQTDELVMERFRPNIVLSGSPAPFDEDYWGDIQIGDQSSESTTVSLVGRCGRCLLPDVDTITGIRDKAVPSRVIAKFRQVEPNTAPCFGMNGVPQSSGVIKVGDSVKVLNVLERETFEL